ncbi:tRNA (adenosine(37)-N6)-threonylcarbamoyltransferase complex dimerization subunit type 1 TsaB [Leucobacter sp. CSA1]|uniref:tRNA (Adenosine(37)-N6)-threonylcarbamoyltransferase complex dimerization subunit type 1 TsaB n=2 Tax=Leucobacter chromiisoli TaxID=2796471 RepID=A0A934Q9P9_9MICO|nr:tRNA (adenosine(37)-N6)-threonylcarbamoyltransferase complex dimerization subunit type 1 TsaB [Leucobacter chromiisoli]
MLSASPVERVLEAEEQGAGALLAIDTALGTSVALGVSGRVYEAVSDDPRRHAEAIGGLLARVFAASGATVSAVTGVVIGVGPGPFTGLRVGIAAAQAFALGRGVPLLPLQGHEAVALAVLEAGAASGVRVVQDARRRELFVTEYSGLDWAGVPVRSEEPHLVPRAEYREARNEVWPERIPAARLVQLAARRLASGRRFEAEQALYLRAPDVKQPSAVKRVSA